MLEISSYSSAVSLCTITVLSHQLMLQCTRPFHALKRRHVSRECKQCGGPGPLMGQGEADVLKQQRPLRGHPHGCSTSHSMAEASTASPTGDEDGGAGRTEGAMWDATSCFTSSGCAGYAMWTYLLQPQSSCVKQKGQKAFSCF